MSRFSQPEAVTPAIAAQEDAPAPVLAVAVDWAAGHATTVHSHGRAQLAYAEAGVLTLETEQGAWVVPPGLAVWVPAGVVHRVRATTAVRFRTLYVREDARPGLPSACRVAAVTPLLAQLIARVADLPFDYPADGPEARLMAVVLDELASLPAAPLDLPLPRDRRARAVASALLGDPADATDLDGWARRVGASPRTLARLFRAETGLSFGGWRQRRRLLAAIERLTVGEPVTTVALDLGYAGPSAFIAMFRRAFGVSPKRYLKAAPLRPPMAA